MTDMPANAVTLTLAEAEDLAARVLAAHGCDAGNAAAVAANMAAAERDEARSHGLFRLPMHVRHLAEGVANGRARPGPDRPAPGLVTVEADRAFAPVAHAAGLPVLAETARAQGIAALAIRDTVHIAALWPEASALAEQGLVAIAVTSSPPYVAPAGGTRPFFGTNPMAFAWPREGRAPMVWDQASAASARGEIMMAARAGHAVPEGVGIDREGRPTTDPTAILEGGAQLAFGGYKGAAIALMVDLLAGPLMDAPCSFESLPERPGLLVPGGELILAIDPARLGGAAGLARAERLFAAITAEEGARLPGDRRLAARARTERDGIRLDRGLHEEITALLPG